MAYCIYLWQEKEFISHVVACKVILGGIALLCGIFSQFYICYTLDIPIYKL